MSAPTREHLHQLATKHGWKMVQDSGPFGASYSRGTGGDTIVVQVSYSSTGALIGATRYMTHTGRIDRPTKGKQAAVRSWLSENPRIQEAKRAAALFQKELRASAPAIGKILEQTEIG